MTTVKDMVAEWLVAHGYDGLCNYGCGCDLRDLGCCDNPYVWACEPAYKVNCAECALVDECPYDCDYMMSLDGWCIEFEPMEAGE